MATDNVGEATIYSALHQAYKMLEQYEEMLRIAPTEAQRRTAQGIVNNQRQRIELMLELEQNKGGTHDQEEESP